MGAAHDKTLGITATAGLGAAAGTGGNMRARIYDSRKMTHKIVLSFRIPASLSKSLMNDELSDDQKINLVKSYTDNLKDAEGDPMEMISNQYAVALIMALELGAL